jgi:transcriptional regulator with XRE-family HTH domain
MDKFDEKFYKNLGKRITQLRKKAGYSSQEAFAYEVGISRGQYYKYELGINMEITSLLKIIKFHKIPIKEFFGEGFE